MKSDRQLAKTKVRMRTNIS